VTPVTQSVFHQVTERTITTALQSFGEVLTGQAGRSLATFNILFHLAIERNVEHVACKVVVAELVDQALIQSHIKD
jgi:hypothetical protein